MLRATAVARIAGDTTLTMVELIGPVEMNISTSAATIAAQKRPGRVATSASRNSGAASRGASPETQREARREKRRQEAPSQPPPYLPTNPRTTTIAPNYTL